ncbi:hypothetical protein [Spirillospora sp. NPDC047279]|uniref:hypothetical protein n=1 Tax=Spirillospora sp. NPDC047279 TaxID=3155478 RepID=UPI0033F27798
MGGRAIGGGAMGGGTIGNAPEAPRGRRSGFLVMRGRGPTLGRLGVALTPGLTEGEPPC